METNPAPEGKQIKLFSPENLRRLAGALRSASEKNTGVKRQDIAAASIVGAALLTAESVVLIGTMTFPGAMDSREMLKTVVALGGGETADLLALYRSSMAKNEKPTLQVSSVGSWFGKRMEALADQLEKKG